MIKFKQQTERTYPELPEAMQAALRDWLDNLRDSDLSRGADDDITAIEFEARSGFSPHSYNKGGLRLSHYSTQHYFLGTGRSLPEAAQKELARQTDISLQMAKETYLEKYAETLSDLGVLNEQVNYHDLHELGFSELAEELDEYERENLDDDYSSTEHEIMVMFDGGDTFEITVQHMIQDAPYHRKSDFRKSWELRAVNAKQLERALSSIQKEVEKVWL